MKQSGFWLASNALNQCGNELFFLFAAPLKQKGGIYAISCLPHQLLPNHQWGLLSVIHLATSEWKAELTPDRTSPSCKVPDTFVDKAQIWQQATAFYFLKKQHPVDLSVVGFDPSFLECKGIFYPQQLVLNGMCSRLLLHEGWWKIKVRSSLNPNDLVTGE